MYSNIFDKYLILFEQGLKTDRNADFVLFLRESKLILLFCTDNVLIVRLSCKVKKSYSKSDGQTDIVSSLRVFLFMSSHYCCRFLPFALPESETRYMIFVG